jgi:hypothetical protein
MKTISMNFDEYEEELKNRESWGRYYGIKSALDFLDSDKKFDEFYSVHSWIREALFLDEIRRLRTKKGDL